MTLDPVQGTAPDLAQRFRADILRNPYNAAILDRWEALALPDGWLVAGCLFQTVWNTLSGQAPPSHIKDYDLFYHDPCDLSEQAEQAVQQRVAAVFSDLPITLEVCNQARVHLWYEAYFGHPRAPLHSSREGIERFLIPATCVGVTPETLCAPYGLDGLYQGVLRMNPLTPYRVLYERKAQSYRERWPWLQQLE